MQRREAIKVLRKICECLPDQSAVSYVFLEKTRNTTNSNQKGYNLHIKMHVDETTIENIESVTRKLGLTVGILNGDFKVSALEAPMEIAR